MAEPEETDRLRTLVETGIAISSELSLDAVLERITGAPPASPELSTRLSA